MITGKTAALSRGGLRIPAAHHRQAKPALAELARHESARREVAGRVGRLSRPGRGAARRSTGTQPCATRRPGTLAGSQLEEAAEALEQDARRLAAHREARSPPDRPRSNAWHAPALIRFRADDPHLSPIATAGSCSGRTVPACPRTPGRSGPGTRPCEDERRDQRPRPRPCSGSTASPCWNSPRRVPAGRQPVRRLPDRRHGQTRPAPARLGRFRRRQARARPDARARRPAARDPPERRPVGRPGRCTRRARVSSSSASPGARDGTTLHRNGAAAGSQKGIDALSSDPAIAALRLGGPGSGGSPRFQGDLAEVRVYDRQLDEAERRLVEAELRSAWLEPVEPEARPRSTRSTSYTTNCSRPAARSG